MADEQVLSTDRLFIRPWRDAEFPILAALLSDPETMKHWPFLYTEEQARAWFDRAVDCWRDGRIGRWAIHRKEDGTILGDCGLMPSEVDGEPITDLGYILQTRHQGQGYAVEAAGAVLDYGLNTLGLTNIAAHMADDHTASQRVARNLGLVEVGRFINARNRNKHHLIFRPAT